MNVAFPALLVVALLLPGFLLRYTYARGGWGWSSPTSYQRVYEELGFGVALAVPLHFLGLAVARGLGFAPDLRVLLMLLTGTYGEGDRQFERVLSTVADNPAPIATYWMLLLAVAWGGGHALHRLVRATALDHRTRLFRFDNYWYYLLTGEALFFRESTIEPIAIDGVYISAVVTHGSTSVLYRGIVSDFTFDRFGALDTIVIGDAHRRPLDRDRPNDHTIERAIAASRDDRYYEIRGDFLVLRMSEIRTLNLDYFTLSADDAAAPGRHQ